MNTKAKGTRNEHRSMVLLEAAGYACTRAAASLGVWDIIGVGSTDFILLQVKSNRGPGKTELEAMTLFVAPRNARKLLHIWRDGEKMPLVKELTA